MAGSASRDGRLDGRAPGRSRTRDCSRKWRFQSSRLEQPVIFLDSLHRPLIQGNSYHQPIALSTVFSRRHLELATKVNRVEASAKLLDRLSFKAYTFSARAYLQCHVERSVACEDSMLAERKANRVHVVESKPNARSATYSVHHHCTRLRQRKEVTLVATPSASDLNNSGKASEGN